MLQACSPRFAGRIFAVFLAMSLARHANAADGEVRVRARCPFAPIGEVVEGHTYRITSRGTWWDLFVRVPVPTKAAGYQSLLIQRPFTKGRYLSGSAWFSIGGIVSDAGKDRASLAPVVGTDGFDLGPVIARGATWQAPSSGTLYLFANDTPWAYWNNFGSIYVRLVEVGSD